MNLPMHPACHTDFEQGAQPEPELALLSRSFSFSRPSQMMRPTCMDCSKFDEACSRACQKTAISRHSRPCPCRDLEVPAPALIEQNFKAALHRRSLVPILP